MQDCRNPVCWFKANDTPITDTAECCDIAILLCAVQFSVLGVGCAGAAVLLYEGVRVSEVVLRPLPRWMSAPLGGAVCGLIAFKFPQVSRLGSQKGCNMSCWYHWWHDAVCAGEGKCPPTSSYST